MPPCCACCHVATAWPSSLVHCLLRVTDLWWLHCLLRWLLRGCIGLLRGSTACSVDALGCCVPALAALAAPVALAAVLRAALMRR